MFKRKKTDKDELNEQNGENSQVLDIEEEQRKRRENRDSSKHARSTFNNSATVEKKVEEEARKTFVIGKRLSYFVASIVIVVLIVFSGISIMDLRSDAAEAEKALAEKQEEQERLENEYALVNNPEYIENQARERLRMIKPGEILYIFNDQEKESEEDK